MGFQVPTERSLTVLQNLPSMDLMIRLRTLTSIKHRSMPCGHVEHPRQLALMAWMLHIRRALLQAMTLAMARA